MALFFSRNKSSPGNQRILIYFPMNDIISIWGFAAFCCKCSLQPSHRSMMIRGSVPPAPRTKRLLRVDVQLLNRLVPRVARSVASVGSVGEDEDSKRLWCVYVYYNHCMVTIKCGKFIGHGCWWLRNATSMDSIQKFVVYLWLSVENTWLLIIVDYH